MRGVAPQPRAAVVHDAPPQALHQRVARQQLPGDRPRAVPHCPGRQLAMQPAPMDALFHAWAPSDCVLARQPRRQLAVQAAHMDMFVSYFEMLGAPDCVLACLSACLLAVSFVVFEGVGSLLGAKVEQNAASKGVLLARIELATS